MKRYLFRGLDAATREPLTGDLVHGPSGEPYIAAPGCAPRRAIPETVSIATGLRDAAGREVFLGDILEGADGVRVAVLAAKGRPAVVGASAYAFARDPEGTLADPHGFSADALARMAPEMRVVGDISHDRAPMETLPPAKGGFARGARK